MQEQVNEYGRQSGRTTSILHKAIGEALAGENVLVGAANLNHASLMWESAIKMEAPSSVNKTRMILKYWRGSVAFVIYNLDFREGWRGPVYVDHYAYEVARRNRRNS